MPKVIKSATVNVVAISRKFLFAKQYKTQSNRGRTDNLSKGTYLFIVTTK
jgi:hypothetical protein